MFSAHSISFGLALSGKSAVPGVPGQVREEVHRPGERGADHLRGAGPGVVPAAHLPTRAFKADPAEDSGQVLRQARLHPGTVNPRRDGEDAAVLEL